MIIAVLCTVLAAVLAVPEVAAKLPEGLGPAIAAVLSQILHRMNAKEPEVLPKDTQ